MVYLILILEFEHEKDLFDCTKYDNSHLRILLYQETSIKVDMHRFHMGHQQIKRCFIIQSFHVYLL